MKSMPSLTKFEDVLNKEGELIFTNVGYSMYPLIKQREDVLRIVKSDNYKYSLMLVTPCIHSSNKERMF